MQSKSENYSLCPQRENSLFGDSPIHPYMCISSQCLLTFSTHAELFHLALCLWRHLEQTVLIRAANRWHQQSKPILLLHTCDMLVINHLHLRELVRNSSTKALSLHYRKVFTFISLVNSQYMTPNDPAGQTFIHA